MSAKTRLTKTRSDPTQKMMGLLDELREMVQDHCGKGSGKAVAMAPPEVEYVEAVPAYVAPQEAVELVQEKPKKRGK